jgi:hypothetical protein
MGALAALGQGIELVKDAGRSGTAIISRGRDQSSATTGDFQELAKCGKRLRAKATAGRARH